MEICLEVFEVDLEWKDVQGWEEFEKTRTSIRPSYALDPPEPKRLKYRVAVTPDYAGRDLSRVGELAVNSIICSEEKYTEYIPMVLSVKRIGNCLCVVPDYLSNARRTS